MDDLRERVEAVERALTEGEGDLSALAEGAATAERVQDLEATVADLREEVADLAAATQALRGYVGSVRSVNEDVESRADAAVAAVESLEERVDALQTGNRSLDQGATEAHRAGDSSRCEATDGQTVAVDRERTAPPASDHAESCPTCGRDGAGRAADGSSPGSDARLRHDGAGTARDGPRSDAPDGRVGGRTRDPLGDFDPEEPPERVSVDHRDATPGGETPTGRAGAGPIGNRDPKSADGGLLQRARDLL